jgi:hypothetical protein
VLVAVARPGPAGQHDADAGLDGHLLLRVGRGQLRLPGSRDDIVLGYLFAAALMLAAAVAELRIGVRAERRSLETVAAPLSSIR